MTLKEYFNDPLWQIPMIMIIFAVGIFAVSYFLVWPEHANAMTELHKMPCKDVKESVLGIHNNFWLYPEDYSQELAMRCSK